MHTAEQKDHILGEFEGEHFVSQKRLTTIGYARWAALATVALGAAVGSIVWLQYPMSMVTTKSHTDVISLADGCHPFHNKAYKIKVVGGLNHWLDVGNHHYVYAYWEEITKATPWHFEKRLGHCNQYYLRANTDMKWLSWSKGTNWLQAGWKKTKAMPIYFKGIGHRTYKMQNKWPGSKGWWISYTTFRQPKYSTRAWYRERKGMKVELTKVPDIMAPHAVEICMESKIAIAGGSAGSHSQKIKVSTGMKSIGFSSVETAAKNEMSLSSEVPFKGLDWGVSTTSSIEASVKKTLEETREMSSEVTKEWKIDLSKPCYVYQPKITITYCSSKKSIQKGEDIQVSEPIRKTCNKIQMPC